VQAQSLADGRQTVVPRDLVCLSRSPRRPWRPAFLTATTVGLGAGATRAEAILRGLCDWAAHDASAVLAHGAGAVAGAAIFAGAPALGVAPGVAAGAAGSPWPSRALRSTGSGPTPATLTRNAASSTAPMTTFARSRSRPSW
jgi:hypothetical protein